MADFKKYKAKKEKLKMEENKGKSEDLIAISLRWWITEKEEKEAKKKKRKKEKKITVKTVNWTLLIYSVG